MLIFAPHTNYLRYSSHLKHKTRKITREKEINEKVSLLIDSIKSSLTDSKLSEKEKSELINKAMEIIKQKS